MLILAIDLGKYNSMCCFFDSRIQEPQFWGIKTSRLSIRSLLENRKPELVVMEACGPSGWICDVCHELEIKTLVCSTNEEAWCWKNVKRKTDRDDALRLAKMTVMRDLKSVHVPEPEIREQRTLIKYRKTLDRRITRIKNAIRSLFANRGIEIDSGKRAWCSGRERIDSYRKPLADCEVKELWKGELDLELTQLDDLTDKLKIVEERLERLAEGNQQVQRLMQIPGVGRKTAEALVAAIDNPHRFKSARQVSAYLGLVPRQYQSGQTDRNGRISKRGPRLLRTLLLECAWCSVRYNRWAKETYTRIHGGQSTRKKKAGIALARKIAVVAWAMMRDEADWDPKKLLPDVDPAEVKLRPQRSKAQPPGELHAERPKRPISRRRKGRPSQGSRRRAPVRT
jgi:transposase